MSEKMIEIKNVSKWYGPVQVLNDCSVNISKGDVVVVCGPSVLDVMVSLAKEGMTMMVV
eukprot:gene23313-30221_t